MKLLLDGGTTNTKCYVVQNDGSLVAEGYSHFGVKDNGLKNDREDYKASLRQIVKETLESKNLSLDSIDIIVAFGMISSELGLRNIPHGVAPITFKEQQDGVYKYDEDIFGHGIPFYIIRGIRNPLIDDSFKSVENVFVCDFMRGEETQIAGIMRKYKPQENFNVIMFSSHLKIINVDSDYRVTSSMTTMSGQVFDYLSNNSIIAKSVADNPDKARNMTDEEIIKLADKIISEWGLMRAMMLPRFMDYYTSMTGSDRRTYLNAILCLEDLKAIADYYGNGKFSTKKYYFIGPKGWCELFAKCLKSKYNNAEIEIIDGKEKNREISILGAIKLTENI